MTQKTTGFVKVKGQLCEYSFEPDKKEPELLIFKCPEASIVQYYPREDIASLLEDLPEIILMSRAARKEQSGEERVVFRVSSEEKRQIESNASRGGFSSISAFARSRLLEPS